MLFTIGGLAGGGSTASALKFTLTAGLLAFSTDGSYPSKGHKLASRSLIAATSLAILSPAFINELGHIKHRHAPIVQCSGTSRREATRRRPIGRPTMTTSENAGGASGALCVALAAAGIAGGALTIGGSGNDADYGEFRDASDNSDDSDSDDTSSSGSDSENAVPIVPVDEETAVEFISDALEGAPPPPPPNAASELDDENNGPSHYGLGWWFILVAFVVLAALKKLIGRHLFGMDLFMDFWAPWAGKCIGSINGQHVATLLHGFEAHIHFADILTFLHRVSNMVFPTLGFATSLQSSILSTDSYGHSSDDGRSKSLALSELLSPNLIRLHGELDVCSPDAAPLHIDMPDIEYGIAPQIAPKPSSNWEDTVNEIIGNGTVNTFGLSEENRFREVSQQVVMSIHDLARKVWGTHVVMLAAAVFVVALYRYTSQRLQEILDSILDCAALATLTLLTPLVEMCARRVGSAQHIPRLELREREMLAAQWVGSAQPITQLETQAGKILAGIIIDEDDVTSFEEGEPSTTDGIPADCFKFTLETYDSDSDDEAYETDYETETSAATPDKYALPPSQETESCTPDGAVVDHDKSERSDDRTLTVTPRSLPPQEESSAAGILCPVPSTISSADRVDASAEGAEPASPVEEEAMESPVDTKSLDIAPTKEEEDNKPSGAESQTSECQPPPHTQSFPALDGYFSQVGSSTSSVICRASSCPSLIPMWAANPVPEPPSLALAVGAVDTRAVPECLPIPTFEGPSTRKQRRRR